MSLRTCPLCCEVLLRIEVPAVLHNTSTRCTCPHLALIDHVTLAPQPLCPLNPLTLLYLPGFQVRVWGFAIHKTPAPLCLYNPHLTLVHHISLAPEPLRQLLKTDSAALVLVVRGKQVLHTQDSSHTMASKQPAGKQVLGDSRMQQPHS